MVSEKGGVVVMERGRFICGANLLRRWNRGRGFLAQQVACYKITPYGLLGPNSEGGMEFTRDVDVSRPEYLDDVEPWRGRKIICFDMDEVEELERTEDVVYIERSMPLPPRAPKLADATIQDFKSPLDYGKWLCAKGYEPSERIARLKTGFPKLSTAEIGAYARGEVTAEKSKAAHKKWYQDNKPE
ncbi:MAG: hypothetical protein EOL86_09480 [Deltaproteobacteria bacterium]|nr:hypothetical protein [Deltaproteobacteria bacterium]